MFLNLSILQSPNLVTESEKLRRLLILYYNDFLMFGRSLQESRSATDVVVVRKFLKEISDNFCSSKRFLIFAGSSSRFLINRFL